MKVIGMNHLTIATRNLDRSLLFYEGLLGFSRVVIWDRGAYLLAGSLWVCLSYDTCVKTKPLEEYFHVAFTVSDRDFDYFKQLILEAEIPIWKENTSEGDSLYILDPDNNKLEIHASSLKSRIQSMLQQPYSGMQFNDTVVNEILNK